VKTTRHRRQGGTLDNSTTQSAGRTVRLLYCLAIVTALYGSAVSLWNVTTHSGLRYSLPFLGALWIIAIGLGRLFMVASSSTSLDAPKYDGLIRVVRILGIVGLVVGAITVALNLAVRPLLHMIISRPSDNGVEYFVVGMFLQLAKMIAPPGILFFEFSRLLAFERSLREGNQ
jgi:hypothetical protein